MGKKNVVFLCGARALLRIPRAEDGSVDAMKMMDLVVTARLHWGGRGGMCWEKVDEEARTPYRIPMVVPDDDYRMMLGIAIECCPTNRVPSGRGTYRGCCGWRCCTMHRWRWVSQDRRGRSSRG
jgi:hypothetical protein